MKSNTIFLSFALFFVLTFALPTVLLAVASSSSNSLKHNASSHHHTQATATHDDKKEVKHTFMLAKPNEDKFDLVSQFFLNSDESQSTLKSNFEFYYSKNNKKVQVLRQNAFVWLSNYANLQESLPIYDKFFDMILKFYKDEIYRNSEFKDTNKFVTRIRSKQMPDHFKVTIETDGINTQINETEVEALNFVTDAMLSYLLKSDNPSQFDWTFTETLHNKNNKIFCFRLTQKVVQQSRLIAQAGVQKKIECPFYFIHYQDYLESKTSIRVVTFYSYHDISERIKEMKDLLQKHFGLSNDNPEFERWLVHDHVYRFIFASSYTKYLSNVIETPSDEHILPSLQDLNENLILNSFTTLHIDQTGAHCNFNSWFNSLNFVNLKQYLIESLEKKLEANFRIKFQLPHFYQDTRTIPNIFFRDFSAEYFSFSLTRVIYNF